MDEKIWIYDLRTNKHFTLKENQLKRSDLDDFVACWFGLSVEEASRLFSDDQRRDAAGTLGRHQRKESERFKCFAYDDLVKRDKVNLDIFWLKDESLEDMRTYQHQTSSPPRSWRIWRRRWHNSPKSLAI